MFRRIYVVLSLSLLAVSAAVAQTRGTIINRGCSRQRRSRSIVLNKFVSGASGRWRATPRVHSNSPLRGESFGGAQMAPATFQLLRRCSASITCCIFACIFAAVSAASLSAQTAGTILGHVSDTTGAVVPGVTITLIDTATNTTRTTVSTSAGDYTFPDVPPGAYNVEATHPGFKVAAARNVQLQVQQSLTPEFHAPGR